MKKEYEQFTAEEFIADEYFQQWAQFPDKESNAAWNSWRLQHPDREPEIRTALTFINSLQFNTRFPPPSQAELSLERNLQKLSFSESRHKRKKPFFHDLAFRSFTAAMVISLCALGGWFYFYSEPVSIRSSTAAGETRKIALPDGAQVTLNANSSLSYPANLPEKKIRELSVEGEAFFEIPPKKQKRFLIHAQAMNIETAGSSFNIREHAGNTTISVNAGKITVHLKADQKTKLQLEAGDFIRYAPSRKNITRKEVRPWLYTAWTKKQIKLDSLPVSTMIEWLEDLSGHDAAVSGPVDTTRIISGLVDMKNDSVFNESLSRASRSQISKNGGVFLVDFKK